MSSSARGAVVLDPDDRAARRSSPSATARSRAHCGAGQHVAEKGRTRPCLPMEPPRAVREAVVVGWVKHCPESCFTAFIYSRQSPTPHARAARPAVRGEGTNQR